MKIIKIFDQTIPYISGYSIRSRYIAEALVGLGVSVTAFSSPIFPYEGRTDSSNCVKYIRCEIKNWEHIRKVRLLKEYLIVQSIRSTLNRYLDKEIKLIHAHSSVLNAIAASQVAKRRKLPFVYEVRALWEDAAVDQGKTREGGLRYKLTRSIETNILRRADHITVICEGLRNEIASRGIPEEKITVVPNGVDITDFNPAVAVDSEIRAKHGLRDCFVIGFIGTFFTFEGLELLIEAVPLILKKRPDVKFLLVGGGIEEENLRRKVSEYGLTGRVIFSGWVKHEDIRKYYSAADLLVYPRISKRITELVTPLKPLEAMALEKTVIASNVGGLKELIQDGMTGILFPAGNAAGLAEKCLYALNNPGQMRQIARQAREYVIRERNWQEICKRYIEIYNKLGAG